MRRLFKLFGFFATVAAAVWLMRDRLVQISTAREPHPPAFRSGAPPMGRDGSAPAAEQPGHVPPSAEPFGDLDPTASAPTPADLPEHADLERIKGVGPVFANRLRSSGLGSFEQLAAAQPSVVAAAADVSESRAASWIEAARELMG